MLLSILQKILNIEELKCSDFLLDKLEENKSLVKTLKKSPYFKIVEKIERAGLSDAFSDLLSVNLGHFEKIKNVLITSFQER
jgi:hypothetical protein